jgi:hypothetical protein
MHPHSILLSLLAALTVAQSPDEACFGDVAYCAGGPIILRCDGTSLGAGNCEDNLNHPPLGALCVESNSTAGNAICSAVGSSAPPFPSVTGGLGTPTASPSVVTSASSSVSASSNGGSLITVTVTPTGCSCTGATVTPTSHAISSGSTTAVTSTLTSSSAVNLTATPTVTTSVAPVFTGAASSVVRGGKDVFGLVMAGAMVMGTVIAGGGMVWLLG